ncbi:MAG: nucleoside/nucleotide kinase family protein [Marmoricola sp.]
MSEGRRLIGIAGAPGAGKSTYAASYIAGLDMPSAYVPMDGFHLADATLRDLGRLDRKGAPETFDAWGYAALMHRLRTPEPHPVYAPGFERELEQPLAGAIAIAPETEVVLTEGNYLLLDRPEWQAVRAELDEVWFLEVDDSLRRARLVERHVAFGKTPEQAAAWVETVDEPNARLVAASRDRADRVIRP